MNLLILTQGQAGGGATSPPPGTPVGKAVTVGMGDSNMGHTLASVEYNLATSHSALFDQSIGEGRAGYTAGQFNGTQGQNDGVLDWILMRDYDNSKFNICLYILGTNDINNSDSSANLQAAVIAGSAKIKAFGYHIVGVLFPDPGRDSAGVNQRPQYLIYKPWLKANHSTLLGWEGFVDCSLDAIMQGYTGIYEGTYWDGPLHYYWDQSAQPHSTPDGYDHLASLIIPELVSLATNNTCIIPDPPTNMVINNAAHTASVTLGSGWAATDLQKTLDGGRTVSAVTSLPISLPYFREAGLFGLRYAPKNGNNPSDWVFNTVDITGPQMTSEYVAWTDQRWDVSQFNQVNSEFVYANVGAVATIYFYEGFEFRFDHGVFDNGVYDFRVNGTSVGTGTAGAQGAPIIPAYHSGTTTRKKLEIVALANTQGAYNIISGIYLLG